MKSDTNIKSTLKRHQLAPTKKLGQNFLVNRQTVERIIDRSQVSAEDTILEFGVGLGALTIPLAGRVRRVIGLEIDSGLVKYHRDQQDLPDNVELLHQDLLKADLPKLAEQTGGRLKIMANLPYSISNPLLFKLVDSAGVIEWAVLMLQKEVGHRLTAEVNTKEYGVLSVLFAGCAAVERLLEVGPGQFHPRPKVDSVVVRLRFHPKTRRAEALPAHDHRLLRAMINSAFQQRRKTIANALFAGNFHALAKNQIEAIIREAQLSPNLRAENLSIEDYVSLTRILKKQSNYTNLKFNT